MQILFSSLQPTIKAARQQTTSPPDIGPKATHAVKEKPNVNITPLPMPRLYTQPIACQSLDDFKKQLGDRLALIVSWMQNALDNPHWDMKNALAAAADRDNPAPFDKVLLHWVPESPTLLMPAPIENPHFKRAQQKHGLAGVTHFTIPDETLMRMLYFNKLLGESGRQPQFTPLDVRQIATWIVKALRYGTVNWREGKPGGKLILEFTANMGETVGKVFKGQGENGPKELNSVMVSFSLDKPSRQITLFRAQPDLNQRR